MQPRPHAIAELDLTSEPQISPASGQKIATEKWNQARDREKKRGQIALLLVFILAGIVLLAFAVLFFLETKIDDLRVVLEILFTPIVGLVGAATGFYFGERRASDDG